MDSQKNVLNVKRACHTAAGVNHKHSHIDLSIVVKNIHMPRVKNTILWQALLTFKTFFDYP